MLNLYFVQLLQTLLYNAGFTRHIQGTVCQIVPQCYSVDSLYCNAEW